MSEQRKAWIVGTGMVTSLGCRTDRVAAAVRAKIRAYAISDYFTRQGEPVVMSLVPDELFSTIQIETDDDYCSEQHERVIKMAVLALHDILESHVLKHPVPLVLAVPDPQPDVGHINAHKLVFHLVNHPDLPLSAEKGHRIHTGRAAAIQGLDIALRYLYDAGEDYVLLGGSDSYLGYPRLHPLDADQRLLTSTSTDGFAPGEGAGFLLLTRHPQQARSVDNHIIGLCPPGIAEEPGHLYSEEPYQGDGLDLAFKQALVDYTGPGIQTVYSGMTGENHWAKEYGVAMVRNKDHFQKDSTIEHPAECYGDLGAATGAVLMSLSAESLLRQRGPGTHLVYSSADRATRAAVRVEKIALNLIQKENVWT